MGMAAPPLVMRGGNHPPDTKADQTPIKRDHHLYAQRLSKGKCGSGKGSDCLLVAWGLELSSTFPIQEWEPRRSIEMEKRWTLIQIFIWKVCHRNNYHGSLTAAQPSFWNVSFWLLKCCIIRVNRFWLLSPKQGEGGVVILILLKFVLKGQFLDLVLNKTVSLLLP